MRKGKGGRLILGAVLLLAAALILNETVFRIRSVSVEGNADIPDSDIVTLAGLDGGASYFFLNEESLAGGISSFRYLEYLGMEKTFPDRLTLFVKERIPRCVFKGNSGYYLMDEDGMILEKVGEEKAGELLLVTGITVREMRVGAFLTGTNVGQTEAYSRVMEELIVQEAQGLFREFNCTDPDNLLLICTDGYPVTIGDAEDIRAKLLTVRGVLEYARDYGLPGGSLDASVPGYITFTPD